MKRHKIAFGISGAAGLLHLAWRNLTPLSWSKGWVFIGQREN